MQQTRLPQLQWVFIVAAFVLAYVSPVRAISGGPPIKSVQSRALPLVSEKQFD